MEKLIDPVDRKLIKEELTDDKFLRYTNALQNSIYIIDAQNAPNTMLEIGRLRELTFRSAGGGTGKSVDIDEYDTGEVPFKQLLVWNSENEEIISAYRFIVGKDVPLDENGYPHTPTSKLFHFSDEFIRDYWPYCIELGRSFVRPNYQATSNLREGLFALDNIWDGLGTLIVDYPECKYFMGKMTLYRDYNQKAKNLLMKFMATHFKGDERLVHAVNPSDIDPSIYEIPSQPITSEEEFKEAFRQMNKEILDMGISIPPLIKTYLSLSPTIGYFGISENRAFGNVDEICILITITDIYEKKLSRHVNSYR